MVAVVAAAAVAVAVASFVVVASYAVELKMKRMVLLLVVERHGPLTKTDP